MIGRDELLGIAVLYPRTYRRLRRQIAFFALRRFVITMAKESLGLPHSVLLRERTRTRARGGTHGGGGACGLPGSPSPPRNKKPGAFSAALAAVTAKTVEEQQEEQYRQQVTSGLGQGSSPLLQAALSFQTSAELSGTLRSKQVARSAGVDAAAFEWSAGAAEQSGGRSVLSSRTSTSRMTDGSGSAEGTEGTEAGPADTMPPPPAPPGNSDGSGDGDVLQAILRSIEALRAEVAQQREGQQHDLGGGDGAAVARGATHGMSMRQQHLNRDNTLMRLVRRMPSASDQQRTVERDSRTGTHTNGSCGSNPFGQRSNRAASDNLGA